jgi:hypothetical protein
VFDLVLLPLSAFFLSIFPVEKNQDKQKYASFNGHQSPHSKATKGFNSKFQLLRKKVVLLTSKTGRSIRAFPEKWARKPLAKFPIA